MKRYFIFLILISAAVFFGSRFSSAAKPSDYGLKEGDLISAIFSDDPDVYIINENGYKRLFLNPEIFKFYAHLGGFASVKLVTPEIRDSFPTSGFFRNCEDNDQKVFGTSVEGEDQGRLHWINKSGDQAVQEDADFFKKVFCINRKEFNWYPRGGEFRALKEVPEYKRKEDPTPYVICHRPSDDPTNLQTIRVAPESLDAHFQHGDTKGACPTTAIAPTPTSTPQPAELCYNCPTTSPVSLTNECRTFSYSGDDVYMQENGYLNLLKDKGVKITGTLPGYVWSTRLSGTAGDVGEVVGFISPDRSEADFGISDNETLIIELTSEFAQAVEIGLTVTPSSSSNNIPATVSITALNQMGKTVDGLKQTFTGVTDNKLTPATFTLKAPTSEISRIIIQTHQYPSGGVWFKSIRATNACTTVSAPTPIPTPTFTTMPIPTTTATSITVLSPNGGEIWQKGATRLIKWNSSGVSKIYIKLRKGNDTYPGLEGKVTDVIPNEGGFNWTPPATLPNGNDYAIRIIDGNYTGGFDDSDKPFSIISGAIQQTPIPSITPAPDGSSSITILSPNGGENLVLGSTYNITWSSSNVTRVVLDLVDASGRLIIKNLVNVSGNPGSASWTIPTYIQPGQYWMRAGTCSNSVTNCTTTGAEDPVTIYDISDAPFNIVTSQNLHPLKVTSPNGGEQWSIGNKYTVTWENPGSVQGIYVDLYKAGQYLSGLGGLGSYYSAPTSWVWDTTNTPNFTAGSDFKMRVKSDTDSSIYDESDNYFSVSGPSYPVTCSSLKTNSATSRYFDICSGYDNVCFNKYYGTYQGCTNNTRDDCTTYNTNASQNLLCTVSGTPVSSPTPTYTLIPTTPTSTATASPTPSFMASPSFSPTPTPTPISTPTPTPIPATGSNNSTLSVQRLFIGQFDNTKYSLTLSDPDGIKQFSVGVAGGGCGYYYTGAGCISSVFGGEPSCMNQLSSGTVTLAPSDFPLQGYIIDCANPNTQYSIQASMPALVLKTNNFAFLRNLAIGSTGEDVKQLQALLVNEVGYSADLITGYFGRITRDAVKRLQTKYGVRPVSGYFGAITRRALNALMGY